MVDPNFHLVSLYFIPKIHFYIFYLKITLTPLLNNEFTQYRILLFLSQNFNNVLCYFLASIVSGEKSAFILICSLACISACQHLDHDVSQNHLLWIYHAQGLLKLLDALLVYLMKFEKFLANFFQVCFLPPSLPFSFLFGTLLTIHGRWHHILWGTVALIIYFTILFPSVIDYTLFIVPSFTSLILFSAIYLLLRQYIEFLFQIFLFNFGIQNWSIFFYHLHCYAAIYHLFIHYAIFFVLFSIFIIGSSECFSSNSNICVNCRSVYVGWLFFS